MDKLEKKFFPATRTKSVIIQLSTINSDFDFQSLFIEIMNKYDFIVLDVNTNYLPKENTMEISYTVKTPDKLDSIKISQDFSEKTKGLISFSIIDK